MLESRFLGVPGTSEGPSGVQLSSRGHFVASICFRYRSRDLIPLCLGTCTIGPSELASERSRSFLQFNLANLYLQSQRMDEERGGLTDMGASKNQWP